MALVTETITAYFDLVDGDTFFVLDDPVRGVLDNATYTLAGDIATDITDGFRSIQIRRGRDRALDEILVGVATVVRNNYDRSMDAEYVAGPFFGNIKPGKRVTFATNGIVIFDGLIDDLDYDYPVEGDSTVVFDVADCLATLGSAEFNEWTTTAGQLPGARLTSILDRPEVNFPASRDLDTGSSTLQADLVTWGSNVLNYAQLVVKADLGMFFAAKDGTLTFYGRNRTVTGVGAPVFSDVAADGIVYAGITIDYGTELLFNRVSVDATGFTKQTVQDDVSAEEFGGGGGNRKYYSLSISDLPLNSAAQALDLANYLLNLYSSPVNRISSITLDIHALDTDDQATTLSLDIGSVIRVAYTPNGVGSAIDKFCMVEGVEHNAIELWHQMTLKLSNLADGFSGNPFILDDAEYGLLDGVGVLAF